MEIEWVRQFGSPGFDEALGAAAGVSSVYAAGVAGDVLPGQDGAGGPDAFVRKYGDDGDELWTDQFGSGKPDNATGVAVHESSVYLAGNTGEPLSGQAGNGTGMFVRKYGDDGEEIWTDEFGTEQFDASRGVATDGSGVYVAGDTMGAFPGHTNVGEERNAFVRKYNHDGEEQWTNQFGTAQSDGAHGVATGESGVYVVGDTRGFLPEQENFGDRDAFLRKYGHDGEELWTRQFGTAERDSAAAVAVRPTGVYVAGWTEGMLPGQASDSADGVGDVFLRKYDHDGEELWTRQFGSSEWDGAFGVAANDSGVYVTGGTEGALSGQSNAGGFDVFVRKYGHDGTELWTVQFGTAENDEAFGITAGQSGIYVAGYVMGTLPGQSSASDANVGDAFVAKLVEPTTLWGDVDCDGDVAIGDALKLARHLIGLSVSQTQPCPEIESEVTVEGEPRTWGDVDCDESVSIGDALKIARWLLGLSVSQEKGCPEIGAEVNVAL